MKQISSIIAAQLTVLFSLFILGLNAQVSTTDESSSGSCDGMAVLTNSSSWSSWEWTDSSGVIQTNGDTLGSLCSGIYVINYVDSLGSGSHTFVVSTSDPCVSFYVDITFTVESSPGICDGTAAVNVNNGTPNFVFSWSHGATSASLDSLCAGTYAVTVLDLNGCSASATCTIVADTTSDPCAGFFANISTTNENSTGSCDGMAVVTLTGGTAGFSYAWNNGGTNASIDNLCAGVYTVTATDANACSVSATAVIASDSSTTTNLSGVVTSVNSTSNSACDGIASVNVSGGTMPYSYSWPNGGTNDTESGLCAGIYDVIVGDALGDSLMLTFIISDPSTTVTNGTYPDSTNQGTVTTDILEDCVIDYSTIDSIWVNNLSYLSSDSISVIWGITDANGTTYLTLIYIMSGNAGVYTLELSLFCPNKSTNQFVKAYDQVYYNSNMSSASLENLHSNPFILYPNPTEGEIIISSQFEEHEFLVNIYSIDGQLVQSRKLSGETNSVNLQGIQGVYFVKITMNNQSNVYKILKR